MIAQYGKRALSFFLAMIMVLSVLPAQVFAEESHNHENEGITAATEITEISDEDRDEALEESGESEALIALREEIAAYVETYGLTADMPDAVLVNVYFALDGEQVQAAWYGVEDFLTKGMELPLEERKLLLDEQNTKLVKRFYEVMQRINSPVLLADATHNPVDGVTVTVSGTVDSVTEADGTITVSMTGTTSCGVDGYNSADVIITNTSGKKAVITFGWVNNSCVDEDGVLTSSPFSVTLGANESVTIDLWSPNGSGNSGTFVLSDFSCEAVQGSVDVTFEYDAACGSVTHNGEVVANGAVVAVDVSGATLQAAAAGNSSFLAWVDGNDKILSREATFSSFAPETAMTVKAVFAANEPVFLVDDTYVVKGLNEALAKGGKATLMNDAVLPAGNYEIPAGDTLLIPFDEAGTLYTTSPASVDNSYSTPYAFRTLTMASGANITVNGAMSLSAKHNAANGGARGSGSPVGPVPFVKMESNSNITVNSGGALYAYGYIIGDGSVTANSGATVYENFQFEDFRGGSQATGMENRVFPLSQYYVQNIEVPLTIYSGAKEYSYTSIYFGTFEMAVSSSVGFIGDSGSMFNITSGYVTKRYDGATDRLILETHGNVSLAGISMKVSISSIDSKDYDLPINSNITLTVCSGSNISIAQSIVILPGAEIVIEEGATCALNSGYNAFVFDADEWGAYTFANTDYTILPVQYAPSRTYTRTDADLKDVRIQVDGTMTASGGLITTAGGANICSSGTGKITVNHKGTLPTLHQYRQAASTYDQIPVTFAQLKNADGSYTQTAGISHTFKYVDGKWVIDCEHNWAAATCTAPKTCGICGTTEGVALGHTWVAATCTDAEKCSVCGTTGGAALGHASSGAATCTTAETCTRCGTVITAALGHDESGAEATCTTAKTCVRCGAELAAPLGHAAYNAEVIAPTCDAVGYTKYTCSRGCGDFYTDNEVAALGHQWGTTTYQWDDNMATCTASHTCRAGDADLEHTDTETVTVKADVVEATCNVAGYTTYTADFTVAWAVDQSDKTEAKTDPDNHKNVVVLDAVDATCTTTGLTKGEKCSDCQKVLTAQETVDALGHEWGETDYEWADDKSTCTATRTCSRGCTESQTATATSAVTQEANCQQIEITTYTAAFAQTWAATQTATVEGEKAATKHPGDKIEEFDAIEVTCTTNGYEGGKKCTACGVVTEGGAMIEEAPGHEEVVDKAVAATCTAPGKTAGKHCDRCDEVIVAQETVAALGHDEVNHDEKAPTCTDIGWDAYVTCSRCDYTTYVEKGALGHDYDEVVTEPTCTADGYTTYTCSVCGEVHLGDYVTELGHTEVVDKAVEATCTETGKTEGKHCSVCGVVIKAQETVDALGHTEVVDKAVEATCTETGLTEGKHCSVCDEVLVKQETVDAKGHTEVVDKAVEATCTETGLTEGKHCSVCNEVLVKQETVDAKGHAYEDGACKDCGEKDPDATADVVVTPVTGSATIDYTVVGQVVTVTHDVPCKVGYLVDGAYVAVAAVANEDGSYSFAVPEGVTEVALVVKGDVNGDGKMNNTDKTRLNAYLLDKVELNALNLFASDATGDNTVNNTDKTRMNAVLLEKTTLAW